MGLQINFKDPRYQRELLAAGQNPLATQGQIAGITSRFTQQQMGEKLAFGQLGLQRGMHRDKMQFAKKQLKYQKKAFNKRYDSESDSLLLTSLVGAGTGIYSAMEGNRRAELTRQASNKRQSTMDEILRRLT